MKIKKISKAFICLIITVLLITPTVSMAVTSPEIESVVVDDYTAYYLCDGYYETENVTDTTTNTTTPVKWFFYNIDPTYTVNFTDGTSIKSDSDGFVHYKNFWGTLYVSVQKYTHQLSLGENTFNVKFNGVLSTMKINLVKLPIKKITVNPITTLANSNGTTETYYKFDSNNNFKGEYQWYKYNLNPTFTVQMEDGTTIKSVNNTFTYNGKTFTVENTSTQSYSNQWTGGTYKASLSVSDYSTNYKVTVIPNTNYATEKKLVLNTNTDKKDVSTSAFGKLRLKAISKTNSVTLKWAKVSYAKKYVVFGKKCGSNLKKLKVLTANSLNIKNLKKATNYKFLVVAVYSNTKALSVSKVAYTVTKGGKYGNPTAVKSSKSSYTIKSGKTFSIAKASVKSSKKVKNYANKLRYESTNTKVAKVSSSGKITAKSVGKCNIYMYAQNGIYKKLTITVK